MYVAEMVRLARRHHQRIETVMGFEASTHHKSPRWNNLTANMDVVVTDVLSEGHT